MRRVVLNDAFAFISPLNADTNVDHIGDFTASKDTIVLASGVFSALTPNETLGWLGLGGLLGDAIDLLGGILGSLSPSQEATPFVLPAYEFLVLGTRAQDGNDRILYNPATGALSYDADGNRAGAAMQFAVLDSRPIITNDDILVV